MKQGRVSVAESNNWDVDIGCLGHWLVVNTGVSHHQKARLTESRLYVKENSVMIAYKYRHGTQYSKINTRIVNKHHCILGIPICALLCFYNQRV